MNLDEIKRRINPAYQDVPGTESYERKWLCDRIDELLRALDQCRFALEPYDDIKPRDWKTDREKLAFAHQAACTAIARVKESK